jgi:hypothetical protein
MVAKIVIFYFSFFSNIYKGKLDIKSIIIVNLEYFRTFLLIEFMSFWLGM